MGIVFQAMHYSNDDFRQKLVKIFTTWEALELFRGIQAISMQHNMQLLVSTLWISNSVQQQRYIDAENRAKIMKLQMEFEPQYLPYDIVIDPFARIFTGKGINP
jgi:hypothetical protein